MERAVRIAPSLLSADFSALEKEVLAVEKAGADYLHFDVMDGHFVPNLTFGPLVMESLKGKTSLPFDTHLMVENPELYIEPFRAAGSRSLTVQAEGCIHLQRTLCAIREAGMLAGVALNPATPLCMVEHVLSDLDLLLIMTVNPGFAAQTYIPAMTPKIRMARELLDRYGRGILLEVDGGINKETAAEAVSAGAEVLVAGSFVFHSENYEEAIRRLRGK